MTQDELNTVTQEVIAELKKSGTNIADASVVSDISQVNNLVAYGKNGKVIKVTPQTIQESVVKHVAWNDSSRLNDFTTAGVYEITGERKMSSEYDNLPIENSGGGHTISARLEVLDSSIDSTTNSDDKCITQKLTLSNRVGGDGNVYIRTGRGRTYDSITWEKWGALQTNINVGQIGSLDEFVDNGIYSGVWTDGSSFAQTFVMVVINDYAVAGDNKTIVQYKYAYDTLKGNGEPTYNTRSLHNGVWSDWEDTHDDDLDILKDELLSRIQGTSQDSDAVKDPFKFIGNYDGFEALIEKLDTMHNVEGITGSSVHNGHFRALVGSKLVDIVNEAQGYAHDVWSQRITCAGIVLRNNVVKTETSYSEYSDDAGHKYRQRRYVQKFVDAVSGSVGFDVKGSVKTFCRRHHLTGDDISTWTQWYDVENPYVQTQNYGKKIALFGASFAQNFAVSGYEFTHEGTSYKLADYIAEKLGAVAFDDYAVGSQGMRCDDNSPFPVHLMNQLKTAQSNDIYDIYIIMGGVNDYWCDKVPLGESTGYASGSSDDEEQNISYCGGLLKAIDYIRLNAPNAKIYTITPFKGYNAEWGWNPRTKIRNAYGNTFYEFVQAQKEVSQVKGVPCLDLWAMQGFSGANATEHYISDLLHPNGNGYYKASEKIVEFVAHGVGSEVVDVQALSTPLDVKITAEIQRAKDAEKANADAINAEVQRAKQAEQANRQLISDLVGESPETLDTIHEISSWILNDETGAAAMAKKINENKNAIAEEAQRAEEIAGNLDALTLEITENQSSINNIKNQAARFDGNAFSATENEVKLITTGVNISNQWSVSLPTVTPEKAGIMSAEDKKILENLFEEAVKFDTLEVEELGDGIGINYGTFDGDGGSIEIPFATEEKAGMMSAEDKSRLEISNSYLIKEVNTLQDAINALNNIIPDEDRSRGVKVVFADADNVVHTYTFMSDKGFTNPTRWKSDVVNPYIESEQPIGFAYRLSDIIDYIKVTVTGDVDTDSVYSFGVCGYFTSADRHELQVLKDGKVLGYIYLDSVTYNGTLSVDNIIIEAKVNTLDFTNGGTVYDYSQYYNRITPQLFINAKVEWETGAHTDAIAMLESKNVAVVNEIKNIEETIFEKEKEDVNVTYKGGYYKTTNGAYAEDAQRCCTDKIDVVSGEKYFVTVNIGGSGVIAYLAQWNNDAWVGIADDFKANSGNAVEREFVVPDGVTHIAVCSYNTTPPTLTKQVVGDSKFYTKDEIYTKDEVRQLLGDDSAVKVYGVRNDLGNPALTTWERTGDAIGMVASVEKHSVASGKDDFLDIYPFNAIRECNIETLDNGATRIIYKGEDGFSLTDKDVFVEFPLWYERRYIKDGYEYREICAQQAGGFYPSPMFIEDGRVLDRVYIAKYETSFVDGIVCSKSGEEPLTYKTVAEFRELYKAKGNGYSGMDIRTVMSLQHLYLVRFAEKNTQNYIGGGYTDLYQPWGYAAKDYSGTVGGEVMVKNYVKTYPANSTFGDLTKVHWVGKQIGFVKSNESLLYDRATITDMVVSEDGKQYTIYFDKDVEIITEAAGSPANSDSSPVRTWFGGCGQDTGATDSLLHDTGSTALAVANNKGSCAVKLFGLENMWGNVWHELDGIIFKGEYAFIGFSQKDYNNNADGYIPVAHQMLEQATLGSVGAQFCFIGNMWIDNAYPWVAYPQAVRGGSPTDITRYTDGVNENSSYGDAYYFDSSANGGVSYEVHGGGFDHYERAGFFCHRCWNGINHKWYLQGSRMQFKMAL